MKLVTRSIWLALCFSVALLASPAKRARDWGVPFDGTPGRYNAITDVKGVEIGMVTLDEEPSSSEKKEAYVHTGVTAILPTGKSSDAGVPGAWSSMNGNGEMTGTTWLEESGFLEGPILLTNTHSVGVVRDSVIAWGVTRFPGTETYSLPVVGETWDGELSDINGFHITREHVFEALNRAKSGAVAEGNVGGGTGMILCEYKGGTGTASRLVGGKYTVGVLVQANYGLREDLRLAGVPIGQELSHDHRLRKSDKDGSILVVVATDAPFLPHQLKRIIKRVSLGLGRAGAVSRNSSGDLFVAFSTARPKREGGLEKWDAIPNDRIDAFFAATIQATEEAIANVLFAARTMRGPKGLVVHQMPAERVAGILRKYGRLGGEQVKGR